MMTETTVTTDDPERAISEWFDAFGSHVAEVEYEPARGLVADDVLSFGTRAELVEGLDRLVERQWKGIWPYIEDFRFVEVRPAVTGDEGWAAANWQSTGFDEDGNPFDRPGRATIALNRRGSLWLATHTHFSLAPGIPQETYGPEGKNAP